MSGSDWITAVRIAATIAALMSLDTIVRPSSPLALLKDLLHRPDRRGEGLPHLIGQSHPRADIGRLASDDETAGRPAAHRREHGEDLVWREAVRVKHPVAGHI